MGEVFKHEGLEVEVILASESSIPRTPKIVTLRARYPRIIHSEIMTHRVFSRNARSSRAVPVSKILAEIRDTPFVPWHWGKNQKGMQAGENFSPDEVEELKNAWLVARNNAFDAADSFRLEGVHKQIANRLLEPFSYIDTLITSTDWDNFFWLRCHEHAEPHFQDLARLMEKAISKAPAQSLKEDDWHLPYIEQGDTEVVRSYLGSEEISATDEIAHLLKLSAARCARISYAPFNGDASIESELERYDLLVGSSRVHASPLEHQAKVGISLKDDLSGNLGLGWIQYRKLVANEYYRKR